MRARLWAAACAAAAFSDKYVYEEATMRARLWVTTLTVALSLTSAPLNAAITETIFSGTVTNGSFAGQLIADWNTGAVSAFYADVAYNDGTTMRYSIQSDLDKVWIIDVPGERDVVGATEYWADGTTRHHSVFTTYDFYVSRYQRIGGVLTLVPDPKWDMVLDLVGNRWIYSEADGGVVPCGTRTCWEYTRNFSVHGQITSLTTTGSNGAVPEPGTLALLSLGLAGLALTRGSKQAH